MNPQDYPRIEKAIRYIEAHADEQPSLERVADAIGLSPYHFQRLFQRWAGVSPKRFLQYLTAEQAKKLLHQSASVLDAAYGAGLSSPGRLHDLMVAVEAITPGEYKARGLGLEIRYGIHDTPFGPCLLATTARGICALAFIDDETRALEELHQQWPGATLVRDEQAGRPLIATIFSPAPTSDETPLRLLLRGTNLQIQVWKALLRIPEGNLVSYSALAQSLGLPRSARAVANAVGKNPIAYLIPCHRVLRSTGEIGGYRWGIPRKKAILARELAVSEDI